MDRIASPLFSAARARTMRQKHRFFFASMGYISKTHSEQKNFRGSHSHSDAAVEVTLIQMLPLT